MERATVVIEVTAADRSRLYAGEADVRCGVEEAAHPWLVRITLPTRDAQAFEQHREGTLTVGCGALRVEGKVASGRLHQPGPSVVDLFGMRPCPIEGHAD